MTYQALDAGMGKPNRAEKTDLEREDFWMGYIRGLRRGHYGKIFGTDREHALWWSLAEDKVIYRQRSGMGYRAGYRCAKFGPAYCSRNSFCCETCPLVKDGLNCHKSPTDPE